MASSKNPWERYVALQDSLTGLVMSGARSIEWVNERLQTLLDLPRPRVVPALPEEEELRLQRLFDAQFPRRGWDILEALAPILDPAFVPGSEESEVPPVCLVYRAFGGLGVSRMRSHRVSDEPPKEIFENDWRISDVVRSGIYHLYLQHCLGDDWWFRASKCMNACVPPTWNAVPANRWRVEEAICSCLILAVGDTAAGFNTGRDIVHVVHANRIPVGRDQGGVLWVVCL